MNQNCMLKLIVNLSIDKGRLQREIEQLNEQIDLMKQDNKVYITEENKNRLGAHENNFERTMRFTRTDKDSLEQLVNAFKLMKPFEGPKF